MDFVDINPDVDTPLFLDPYYISKCEFPFAISAYESLRSYFDFLLALLRGNRIAQAKEVFSYLGENNDICHMRMDLAYQRLLKTRTHKDAKRVKERDVAIEELYQQVEKECTDEGKKLLFKYTDEMVYRESDDADFYYKSGFYDGVQLMFILQKMATKI